MAGTKSSPAARKSAESTTHSLVLREETSTRQADDLDKLGIAKNAREEKKRARDEKLQASAGKRAHGEAVSPARAEGRAGAGVGADRIDRAGPAPLKAKPQVEEREEVGSFGD